MMTPHVFSGRRDELSLLTEYIEQALEGQPQAVLIEGEPGIGKTALLEVLAGTTKHRGKRVRVLSLEVPSSGPYDPVLQAVAAITRSRFYRWADRRREDKDLLFEWLAAIPAWGELVAAITATADALHRRRRQTSPGRPLDENVVALLKAAQRPLILLLDDLHLADQAAIARLETLIRVAGDGTCLLLVGTYRPAAVGAVAPPIRKLIDTLPAGSVRHLKLGALTAPEASLWLDQLYPNAARPAGLDEWLFESTGGRPAAIRTTLDHLVDQGAIRSLDGAWEIRAEAEQLERAEAADSLIDLSSIKPEVAQVVQVASVLGEEFDSISLASLLERDELYVEDLLALGVHHGLLHAIGETEMPDGEIATLYRFAAPHLRSAVYHSLPAERREILRRQHRDNASVP